MKFTKHTLPNGLTILHEKRDVNVTTVMLAAKYGSAYETKEQKGMAHFIEHLCFKGTKKRTTREIAKEVEDLGAQLNAFTSEEVTAYFVKLSSRHLDKAMDVIFDVFFNPTFPEEEVKKEASVICEEIKMYEDNPQYHSYDKIKENLYEEPFGLNIAGSQENVLSMTREQLYKQHRRLYHPANAILIVIGNNTFEDVKKLAELHSVERTGEKENIKPIITRTKETTEQRTQLQQTNIALGIPFPLTKQKEYYAAEIFNTILGEGMSSNLFTEIREKRGLVYGIHSHLDSGTHYGYFMISAGTDPTKTEEVIQLAKKEYQKMKEVTKEQIEEAKTKILGKKSVKEEDSSHTAIELLTKELAGNAEEYYKHEEHLKEVTLEDIKTLAEKTNWSSFTLGP
jgi:predicted Zn-dependent peptidase